MSACTSLSRTLPETGSTKVNGRPDAFPLAARASFQEKADNTKDATACFFKRRSSKKHQTLRGERGRDPHFLPRGLWVIPLGVHNRHRPPSGITTDRSTSRFKGSPNQKAFPAQAPAHPLPRTGPPLTQRRCTAIGCEKPPRPRPAAMVTGEAEGAAKGLEAPSAARASRSHTQPHGSHPAGPSTARGPRQRRGGSGRARRQPLPARRPP